MREIKFRAWNRENNKMYEWEWLDNDSNIILDLWKVIDSQGRNPYPFEIEQFTGLHDKNGTEIYEGDILRQYYGFDDEEWIYFEVAFGASVDGRWGFYIKNYHAASSVDAFESLEVAGNIHENKELLCVLH